MISTLLRKTRTLIDIVHDFQREPLASLDALDLGLMERASSSSPALVSRVVAAYQAAKRDQRKAGKEYQANGEWSPLIQQKLQALSTREFAVVLDNFFRNEVFGGLSDYATPVHLRQTLTRIGFVNHMLHDYRVWLELTGNTVEAIQTPIAGNPFGYFIDEVLATPGCFRRHYMAQKAIALINGEGTVGEIGGGYGEFAYFALQSRKVRYIDFDLPEVLLIASYWLCRTVPDRTIVLYGEDDPQFVLQHPEKYDAILFPNFCLPHLPDSSVDVFVNTRSMSEMEIGTISVYLNHITRSCTRYFLHENSDKPIHQLDHTEIPASSFEVKGFRLISKTMSAWKAGAGRYREFLYERV